MSRYFYIISIFWNVGPTPHNGTYSGVTDVAEGETPETVYQALFRMACEQHGAPPARTGVRYYYLVRNEL